MIKGKNMNKNEIQMIDKELENIKKELDYKIKNNIKEEFSTTYLTSYLK
jgi:hypothetical protein